MPAAFTPSPGLTTSRRCCPCALGGDGGQPSTRASTGVRAARSCTYRHARLRPRPAHHRRSRRRRRVPRVSHAPRLAGLGHGIGAALVGAIAFCIRDALNIDVFSTYMEAAVGISIMVIGLSGIAEVCNRPSPHTRFAPRLLAAPPHASPPHHRRRHARGPASWTTGRRRSTPTTTST